jgi:uncharacterized protein (TIGR02466 family)
MSSKIEMVFPSFIYRGRLSASTSKRLNRDFEKEITTLSEIDNYGREWSQAHYVGGYSSYSSMANLHHTSPNFGELANLLQPHVAKFAKALNWDLRRRKLHMTTCWANAMGFGTHHTLHLHPHSVISGVYYVNMPTGSSPFKIEDPRMNMLMASPARKPSAPANQQPFVSIAPKAGEFILFESWMRHEVPPHRGKKSRMSISFNFEV